MWQAGFNTDIAIWGVAAPRLFMGIGISCFFLPLTTLCLSGLPPDRIASAAGLTNFSRILMGGFGTSLSVALWDDRISYHRAMLAEKITPFNPAAARALEDIRSSGVGPEGAIKMLDGSIIKQAVMLATNDIFLLGAALFFFLIPFIWLAKKSIAPGGR
jgi:DHA2 family multidrug resistance protein